MKAHADGNLGFKEFVKGIPLIGSVAGKVARHPAFARVRNLAFPGSANFWEKVYSEGGTSGPGSYGRLAQFKAEVLNEFVRTRNVRRVIEFGCGDGAQLGLASYPEYVGVDVSAAAVKRCSTKYAGDRSKRFLVVSQLSAELGRFDLAMSLDVIYHLIEDSVFHEYMTRLFQYSDCFVAIYASNYDGWTQASHVRHRKFTEWIEKNARDWEPAGFIPNRYPEDPTNPEETSFANFHFFARKNTIAG